MKFIKTLIEFINEAKLGLDLEKGELRDYTEVVSTKVPRYLLHVSEPDNRPYIQKHGLVPKNADSKKWGNLFKSMGMKGFTKSVFATTLTNNLDIYDIQNINRHAFALPTLGDYLPDKYWDKIQDLVDETEIEIKNLEKKPLANNKWARMGRHETISEIINDLGERQFNMLRRHSKIDLWLIDTLGLNAVWYIDQFGVQKEIDINEPGASVYTKKAIPSKYITLIKPENQDYLTSIETEPSAYDIPN